MTTVHIAVQQPARQQAANRPQETGEMRLGVYLRLQTEDVAHIQTWGVMVRNLRMQHT